MTDKENKKFVFSYSAPTENERREIESIRRQYTNQTKPADKLTRLRMLDKRVRRLPFALSVCIGILGCLVFGAGMALVLERNLFAGGIPLMLIGVTVMLLAHPLRKKLLSVNKRKYGDEIMRLSDELLHSDEQSEQ